MKPWSKPVRRIFVAEDDLDLRLLLGETLTDEGFDTVLFPTAEALLRGLEHDLPTLIVTDLVMPGLSGVQLLRVVRADARWRHLPLIVMTGSNDTALPLRIDAPIVCKPDTDALIEMIRKVLGDLGDASVAPESPSAAPEPPPGCTSPEPSARSRP